ncbi:MAG: hypothetical protein EPO62_01140 [Candidatus Nitrosotenuis sp.]|nr:MAG: hypothetical protein EPO62_01140 [Candidatus Nitrosotenuis sp.]
MIGFVALGFGHVFAERGAGANLWAPTGMVTGENYDGVVILDEDTKHGQMLVLSTSDPTIIKIPESVTILPNSNHGIFPIKAAKEGSTTVFAAVDGQIIQKTITVYSSSRVPEGLRVILPANTTKTENMLGYIMTVDSKGSPAPVSKDVKINLNTSPLIQVDDDSLLIKSGSHLAKFSAKIKGTGKIFANADGLRIGEQEIVKAQDSVTVKVAVAPNIILKDSKAYFFVWLEKDGRPYKPPYVIHAFLSSNNLDSIRFTARPDVKQYSDSVLQISLTDGVGSGSVISGNDGSAVITANVDEFGSAQTSVVVGPVLIDENFQPVESKGGKLKEIEKQAPNIAFVWFYPSVTDSKGYGIIALYNMNSTKNTSTDVDTNGTSVTVSSTINRVVPVPLDGRTVSITSSGGLQYPNVLRLSESNEVLLQRGIGHNHAAVFEITGKSQGKYIVSSSGPGLERYQSKINIVPPYRDLYQLKIMPIPALPGNTQALAMVSIVDDSGALIDAQKMFAGPVEVLASAGASSKRTTITSQNSAIYSGSITEPSTIIFSSAILAPVERIITPVGIATSISVEAPIKVHISERIPFAIHETDSFGIPLRKVNSTNISSTPGISLDGNYLEIDNIGNEKLAAVSKTGASSLDIEAFANNLDFSIIPVGITNRIDREFELHLVSDVKDMDIRIESPFPYKKIDDLTYAVTPDKEGYLNVTFTAFKKGYMTSRNSFSVSAEKIVNVEFRAFGSDGKELNIENHIEIGNVSKSIVTPYQGEFKSQFLKFQFPPDVVIGNHGYHLNTAVFADQEFPDGKISNMYLNKDSEVVAKYDRMIKIDAENAHGGGFYPYGQTVILSVPPKDKFSFLVREVFDHWEGIPYDTDSVSFIATDDVTANAVLRDDYLFLMLVFGFGISVMMYFRFVWKKGISLFWYLQKITDGLKIINFDKISFKKINMKKTGTAGNNSDHDF